MAKVMGVLNITPDSFSDGGMWLELDAALRHARQMVAEGADVIDVGGESTRPGASPVAPAEEMRRVLPVVEALSGEVAVSIDTRNEAVARAAVAAGARLVNDVSASLWRVAADTGAGWVAMHMPAEPSVMASRAHYGDVVTEVTAYLLDRASQARRAGVTEVWIDPGIGFAKTAAHNFSLLRRLDELVATGWPVLVGTSRKSFLAAPSAGRAVPADPVKGGSMGSVPERMEATVATCAWAILKGASMVRVHDVASTVMAASLAAMAS